MSFYSQYRGRTTGRVMHALSTYCGWASRMDETTIGEGEVKMGSKVIATYEWIGEDTPHFTFWKRDSYGDVHESYQRKQTICEPFLDDPYAVDYASFAAQEVRSCLTFSEALAIRHVRDKMNGEWGSTVSSHTVEKIKQNMKTHTYSHFPDEWYEQHWKHFALCAIMEI